MGRILTPFLAEWTGPSNHLVAVDDWDGDLSKLSEQSARRLLAQIEEKIALEEAKEAAQFPAGQVIDGESERVSE